MTKNYCVIPSDVGMLRIYLRRWDKAPDSKRFAAWGGRPLYRELFLLAKEAGIVNAVVRETTYGFGIPNLTVCVELVGDRPDLEAFCRQTGALLHGKVIVFEQIERWAVDEGNEPSSK